MKVLLVGNYPHDGQESMLRFAAALGTGLSAAGVEVQIARPEPFFGRLKASGAGVGKWLGYLDKFILFPPRLRRLAEAVDVVHICDHSNAIFVKSVAHKPHLVTCHDMLAIRSARGEFSQNQTAWSGRILQRRIVSGLRRARRLTCVSEATRRDVLRLTERRPETVTVTAMGQNYPYAAVSEIAEAAAARRRGDRYDRAIFRKFGVPEGPYLLHVGGTQWYKNRAGVLAIYAALRSRLEQTAPRLLLVGPSVEAVGVETRTDVDNSTLAALYSAAELLLFPSLEEGFGWPIIEAQACGCLVLTTDKNPMREVGGSAAFYLSDPADAEAGATAVAELLSLSQEQRATSVASGVENAARFSTDRMISEYLIIYNSLLTG
jgi:glycosyltransferase involved in cell wall biosynthesis